jgi:hypothetical protein
LDEKAFFEGYKNVKNFLIQIKKVKLCFFKMIRKILRFYLVDKDMLSKFKGHDT